MGRRKTITEEVTDLLFLILSEANGSKKNTADSLYKDIRKMLREKNKPIPGKHALAKEVTRVKKIIAEKPPLVLDKPWSIGACKEEKLQLSTEDILHILRVRKMQLKDRNLPRLSIRQALWMARLYAVVLFTSVSEEQAIERLWMYSFQYAIWDKVCELKGEYLHTRELDDVLLEGFEKFMEICKSRVFSNADEYKKYYISHSLSLESSK